MMFAIFRQAVQPRLAMQLLQRAVEPDALARVARSTGRIPSRRSAIELVASDIPFLSEVAQIIELAVARPWMPSYPRVSVQLQTMLEAVLTGRLGSRRRSPTDGGDDRSDHRATARQGGYACCRSCLSGGESPRRIGSSNPRSQ